mgnify:CR=1 FL=1
MKQSDSIKKYTSIRIKIPEEYYDSAYGIIFLFDPIGIEEKFDELVVTFLAENFSNDILETILDSLKKVFDKVEVIDVETIKETNWNEEWEQSIQPIDIDNKIFIRPEWIKQIDDDKRINIIINPKMSFGTGHHATTRLVAKLLLHTVKKGSTWIDAGCGTGILSIIALKLGAKSVLAIDNNDWAIENAKENLKLNSIKSGIELKLCGVEDISLPDVHGIMANLYTHLLLSNFEKFYSSLKKRKGLLLASGVLSFDEDLILKKAVEVGFNHIKTIYEDEWCAFHFSVK